MDSTTLNHFNYPNLYDLAQIYVGVYYERKLAAIGKTLKFISMFTVICIFSRWPRTNNLHSPVIYIKCIRPGKFIRLSPPESALQFVMTPLITWGFELFLIFNNSSVYFERHLFMSASRIAEFACNKSSLAICKL